MQILEFRLRFPLVTAKLQANSTELKELFSLQTDEQKLGVPVVTFIFCTFIN